MAARTYASALLPALCAAFGGGFALIAGASATQALAVATLTAAAAGLLSMHDEPLAPARSEDPRQPDLPVPPARSTTALISEVFEAVPFGIMIVAPDRTILRGNAHVIEMFSVREIEGLPVATLRARRMLDCIDDALNDGVGTMLEFSLSRGGEAFLRAHITPLTGGSVLVAISDETQIRRTGEVYRDFVANASHELKTPLAAISGIIETLLGHARDDPEASERFLGLLNAQIGRMTRLIEDLLSLNKIELNERVLPDTPLNLIAVVSETVDALRPIAEAGGVTLRQALPDTEVQVLGDRNELSQAIVNLIENAIKYGGEGTEVKVRTAEPTPDRPGLFGIEVQDHGPGIAREHIPRLTERFYRVNIRRSREKGGTGLGLAIVKHITSRHRGKLEIESTVGVGSCFRLWLPLAQANAVEEDQNLPATPISNPSA